MLSFNKTYRWILLYTGFLMFTACWFSSDERIESEEYWTDIEEYHTPRDLNLILQKGKLVVLTQSSTNSYFLYKGEAMGFEYELLEAFADHLGVELEIQIADDSNNIFDELQNGDVDLIAANLTVTRQRARTIAFTDPFLYSKQVLVQRIPEPGEENPPRLLRNPLELAGKNIYVHRNSSFYSRLKNLSDEIGGSINIIEAPGKLDPEKLIQMVSEGTIEYTIADENIGLLNQGYYPNIDISMAVSFPQKIAWACRQDSPALLRTLNNWLQRSEQSSLLAILRHKYFKATKNQRERAKSDYSSLSGGQISPYDDLIKKYSMLLGWDWRIIAAQMAQESSFQPNARSWAGAFGLMQLMPQTAAQFGVDTSSSPEAQIKAGIHYMMWLNTYWENEISDDEERIKFVLASYNAGLGHVIDARNLTENYGGDSTKWDDHVDYYLRNKSASQFQDSEWVKYGYCRCEEPVEYVQKIMDRYAHYSKLIS